MRRTCRTHVPRPAGVLRRGFTLVELLIVIAIIAIVASLLLVAASGLLGRREVAARVVEMREIDLALADFKKEYGVLPPSRVYLREDGIYYVGGTDENDDLTTAAQVQRLTDSAQYLTQIFKITLYDRTSPTARTPLQFDWNGDGVITTGNAGRWDLSGDQGIVFFLSGVPNRGFLPGAPTATSAVAFHGFATGGNPAPTTRGGGDESWQAFDFAERFGTQRLRYKNTLQDAAGDPLTVFPILLDPEAEPTAGGAPGMVYFSSYEGRGYRPDDNGDSANVAGTFPARDLSTTLTMMVHYPTLGTVDSPGPNPYTATAANYPVTDRIVVKYLKPDSYQLIFPGPDGLYGPGGQIPPDPAATVPSSTQDTGGGDNVANFAASRLQEVAETP